MADDRTLLSNSAIAMFSESSTIFFFAESKFLFLILRIKGRIPLKNVLKLRKHIDFKELFDVPSSKAHDECAIPTTNLEFLVPIAESHR